MVDTIKQYEDQKIKEVVLYILSKTGVVDYYHLMKILYLAERQHLGSSNPPYERKVMTI